MSRSGRAWRAWPAGGRGALARSRQMLIRSRPLRIRGGRASAACRIIQDMNIPFRSKVSLVFLATLLLALAGCTSVARRESVPLVEWQASSPEAQGFDPSVLARIDECVAVNLPDTTGILVARNGYIVFERYFQVDQETKRPLRAVTKSFTSALVGIAVDKRFIRDIDDAIYDYLPDSIREAMNDVTRSITIRHLLTGTSGFPGGGTGWASGEPRALRSILSVVPLHSPGKIFGDNDANANL